MSPRNKTSKNIHNKPKHPDENASYRSTVQESSSMPSRKRKSKSSTSTHLTKSIATKATSIPEVNTNTNNTVNRNTVNSFTHMEHDLMGVSAWTSAPQHYPQTPNFPHPYNNMTTNTLTLTVTCPYHAPSTTTSDHGTARSNNRHDLTPLERWLAEGANEEGGLTMQSGLQQRGVCTCVSLQDERQ